MGSKRNNRTQPVHVAGRYALFDEIAAGGMASVHLGRQLGDAGFARTVAIKRMRRGLVDDPRIITMFVDEARLAGRVQHPNVVTTIDVVHDHGELFLVMEYVHGESLKSLTTTTGQLVSPPADVSAGIACGALRGLHAAHEAKGEGGAPLGIVHRDVSPQNVLVGADGTTRVVDFGVAKAAGRLQWTQTGQLKGKPRYMAPEQLTSKRDHPVDRRTDVFSMATVLWELLAGKRLFDDIDDLEVLRKVLGMPITSPCEHNAEVPKALALAVLKGLDRTPELRHATARDFARAIEAAMPRGIASQDTVGEWVDTIAGERLRAVEQRILEIESAAPSDARQARDMVGAAGKAGMSSGPGKSGGPADTSITATTGFIAEGTDTEIDAGRLLFGGGSTKDAIRLSYDAKTNHPKLERLDPECAAQPVTAQATEAPASLQTTAQMDATPQANSRDDVSDASVASPGFAEEDGADDITRKMHPQEMPSPALKVPEAHPTDHPQQTTAPMPAVVNDFEAAEAELAPDAAALPPLPPVVQATPFEPPASGASRRRFVAVLFGLSGFFLLLFTFLGTRC